MTVYFIKPIGMAGPIKIGHSCSPERRRDALERWSPFPLEIIAQCDGAGKIERRFHARFAADHIHHEWFKVSDELLAVIAAVKAGGFDIETLPTAQHLLRRPKDLSYITPEWRAMQGTRVREGHIRSRNKSGPIIAAGPQVAA